MVVLSRKPGQGQGQGQDVMEGVDDSGSMTSWHMGVIGDPRHRQDKTSPGWMPEKLNAGSALHDETQLTAHRPMLQNYSLSPFFFQT